MTFSAEPVSSSTSWYGWATDVHNALTSPTSAAAQSSLASTYLMRLSNRSVPGPGALPKLMTSPPTISAANLTGTSTITSAVNVPAIDGSNNPNSAQITFRGGPWQQRGPSPVNMYAWGTPLTGGESTSFPYVEFLYYGTALEFGYRGQGTLSSRVWVDGLLAENAYTADTTQDGALHLRKITFSAAGWRRIRIDLAPAFWGLNIGPTDVVQPAPSTGDKLLVIGDSFGEGTGAQDSFSGYAPAIGAMLGFNELISLSQGGTGVLAINAGLGRPKYRDRSADWPQVNATHVIVQMSVNDDSFSTTALATELALLLPAVRALSTVKTVWVMGRPAVRDTDVTWAVSRDAAIKPAADALGVPWISLTSPSSIWTGSGHVGATTGTGSCDVLVSSDGTHPTQAGHDGIARMFVNRLLAQLPA